jgi:hypothetical protein
MGFCNIDINGDLQKSSFSGVVVKTQQGYLKRNWRLCEQLSQKVLLQRKTMKIVAES